MKKLSLYICIAAVLLMCSCNSAADAKTAAYIASTPAPKAISEPARLPVDGVTLSFSGRLSLSGKQYSSTEIKIEISNPDIVKYKASTTNGYINDDKKSYSGSVKTPVKYSIKSDFEHDTIVFEFYDYNRRVICTKRISVGKNEDSSYSLSEAVAGAAASSQPAGEELLRWDSAEVGETFFVVGDPGWYKWGNIIDDQQIITKLWEIAEKTKSGKMQDADKQIAPNGGYPFEVTFTNADGTAKCECNFFSSTAKIDGKYYLFSQDDYDEVKELAKYNFKADAA